MLLLPLFSKQMVDINKASLDQLMTLPITDVQAQKIMEYRTYVSHFTSIYDLRNFVDQKKLLELKPLVMVSHYENEDETAKRRKEIYYLIRRYGSEEGSQEGMADVWEDYLITPKNINKIFYSDILSMPNMTPVGAASIISKRNKGELIKDYRALRQVYNLTHYEATNLKNFVSYQDGTKENRLFVDYQFRYNDSPYEDDVKDLYKESFVLRGQDAPRTKNSSLWGYFNMDKNLVESTNKIRLRYNNQYKAGILLHNSKGAPSILDENYDFTADTKAFAGYENFITDGLSVKAYMGNFRATFGEGLVMENTDAYSSRKTGFGFTKRITGIIGDMSSTQEYALRGGAVEFKTNKFNAVVWGSSDKKDAVVYDSNNNGVFDDDDDLLGYITMSRRFTNEELENVEEYFANYDDAGFSNELTIKMAPRRDAFQENLIGGHFEYMPVVGTRIGFTGYNAVYDREFVVNPDTLKYQLTNTSEDADEKFELADSEINAMYSTKTDEYDRNFRRVLGFDWGTVIGNTSFQGEYARLITDKDANAFNDNPSALVASAYSSFGNLYILSLYRDYDLGFDNPYSRGFSEHEKYDDSIFDKNAYVLTNPLMADIYLNSAQAQAEKGVYFETRYKFNRYFTLNRTYIDIWERKCDSRKSVRFQGELDFRPIYQISLRLKYKDQINRYDDGAERGVSQTDETTLKTSFYLSNYDKVELSYRYNRVWMPPYPYMANDADAHQPGSYEHDTSVAGTNLIHGDYIAVDYTHNFNENLKMQGSLMMWNGHGISQWDWEDMEIDFMGESGIKSWIAIQSKISDNLYLMLKYKVKRYNTLESEWRAWWNEPGEEGTANSFSMVEKTETAIRLQLDWKY